MFHFETVDGFVVKRRETFGFGGTNQLFLYLMKVDTANALFAISN